MANTISTKTMSTKTMRSVLLLVSCLATGLISAQEPSWKDLAVHNFGAPINTMWAEGELSFADDGTMVYCSARQDMAVAPGDPKDLYIATFNGDTGTWNTPVNMGIPINAPPATDVDPLRLGDDREPWITADGNTIYFKSDRLARSPGNANDLFVTRKVNGVWTEPELLGFPSAPMRAMSIARLSCRTARRCASRHGGPEALVVRTSTVPGRTPPVTGWNR